MGSSILSGCAAPDSKGRPVKLTWNGLQLCYFAAWVAIIASICMSFAAVLIAQDVVAVAGPCGASMQRFSEIALTCARIQRRIYDLAVLQERSEQLETELAQLRRRLTSTTLDMIAAGRSHPATARARTRPMSRLLFSGRSPMGCSTKGRMKMLSQFLRDAWLSVKSKRLSNTPFRRQGCVVKWLDE